MNHLMVFFKRFSIYLLIYYLDKMFFVFAIAGVEVAGQYVLTQSVKISTIKQAKNSYLLQMIIIIVTICR